MRIHLLVPLLLALTGTFAPPLAAQGPPASSTAPQIVTSDVTNFWRAYDAVVASGDSATQVALIDSLYVAPETPGLHAMMRARRYSSAEYRQVILAMPKFWRSIRSNTLRAGESAAQIARGVEELRLLYPSLRPASVTFTIGAFRSGGTIDGNMVLIGAEIMMADSTTDLSEFPARMAGIRDYMARDPLRKLSFLNVHEFVHTQQREAPFALVHRSVYEGVAEFVAVEATRTPSTVPAIAYERAHRDTVRAEFMRAIGSAAAVERWLSSDQRVPFGIRDMGYAIGYAIAEGYSKNSNNHRDAIRTLIDLEYRDTTALAAVVDASGYLPRPLRTLLREWDAAQPRVERIAPVASSVTTMPASIDAGPTRVQVTFSVPMDTTRRGFDYGPGGEGTVLSVVAVEGWSSDRRTLTLTVDVKRRDVNELMVTDRFESADGSPLVPYLVRVQGR